MSDAIIVSAAVLLAQARAALRRYGHHLGSCETIDRVGETGGMASMLGPSECDCGLNAALKALDGVGDVQEWMTSAVAAGWAVAAQTDPRSMSPQASRPIVDAALATPPALPSAEKALAEAFAWAVRFIAGEAGVAPEDWNTTSFAKRWLGGDQ